MIERMSAVLGEVRAHRPLIHCITNPISINQCANAVLAVGARPIMAEHPREVGEITATAQALVLNLGNITDVRMDSMMISAEIADKCGIPFVIDMVGISCSKLRRDFACGLTEKFHPAIIKGNYSEINALYDRAYSSSGVDAEAVLDEDTVTKAALRLARKHGSVILASGKRDIVTDGKTVMYIANGTSQLASVTGTGCMLGALCGCYASVCSDITSAAAACAVLGISGELAETNKGSGSFLVNLIDALSVFSDEHMNKHLSMEEKKIEEI